jgi:hypothetical protein
MRLSVFPFPSRAASPSAGCDLLPVCGPLRVRRSGYPNPLTSRGPVLLAAATALGGGQARNEVKNSSSVLEKANLAR